VERSKDGGGGVMGWVNVSWHRMIEQGYRLLHDLQISAWSVPRCLPSKGPVRKEMAAM
jgi:hypothetical protein